MNVNSYVFESPYSSRVQVGRPDPSASLEDTTTNANQDLLQSTQSTAKEIPTLEKTDTTNKTSETDSSDRLLNIYA